MSKVTKTIAALGVVAGLGVAALPLASYAANPTRVNLTANLDDSLSLSVTETELAFELDNGGAVVKDETAATVITNSGKGYNLNIKAGSGGTALTSGDYTIPAGEAAQGTSAWGYNTDGGTAYTAVTASDVSIAESSTPTPVAGTTTNITIGVSADATQEAGTYTGSFVLTAANKA